MLFSNPRGSKAFTLLELIVVIVILGILATIAIPTFQKVIDNAHDHSAEATLQALAKEAHVLAAFDGDGLITPADVEAAGADLDAVALRAGTHAAEKFTLTLDDQSTGGAVSTTYGEIVYGISADGTTLGLAMRSQSTRCSTATATSTSGTAGSTVDSICDSDTALAGAGTPPPAGTPDPDYGVEGTAFVPNGGVHETQLRSLEMPDGKLLLAYNRGDFPYAIHMRKLNLDGTVDTTWGGGNLNVDPSAATYDAILGLALQSDGKIVAVGMTRMQRAYDDMFIARFNADGSYDTTFNGTGYRVLNTLEGDYFESFSSVVIQPDGKIVAAGTANVTSSNKDYIVTRFNPDGSTDTTFGTSGSVWAGGESLGQVILYGDGRLLLLGQNSDYNLEMVRLLPTGERDSTFGTSGTSISTMFWGGGIGYLQPSGQIVVGGSYLTGGYSQAHVMRFNANGSFDSSFGNGGGRFSINNIVSGSTDGHFRDIDVQDDGKFVVGGTGTYSLNGKAGEQLVTVRITANGQLDTTFSGDGYEIYSSSTEGNDKSTGVYVRGNSVVRLAWLQSMRTGTWSTIYTRKLGL